MWAGRKEPIDTENQAAIAQLLQRVVGDEDAPRTSTARIEPSGDLHNSSDETTGSGARFSVRAPLPLNPVDVTTPVKDPMGNLNSWVRAQTPNSSLEFSPGQTGSQNAPSPPSVNSTPSRMPLHQHFQPHVSPAPGFWAGSYNQPGSFNQLESIYEHRRLLMMQMEELAAREMELRQSPNFYDFVPQIPRVSTPVQISIEAVRGRIYETAKDQHGCRFLQRLLDQPSPEGIEAAQQMLAEILPHIPELMTDQYANFLVQKLFDMMPHDVRYSVAQVAAPHMALVSLTPHGTFSVQKLIETIATREEMLVVQAALKPDVVRLVKDVHGNHVIQKVLQRFEHEDAQFIYDALTEDCVAIATNKQGCCVLQRCLEFASQQQRALVVKTVVQHSLELVQDPFGNYVIQYVLDAKDATVNDVIAELFLPHLVMLSMNKFSSNVVEKTIRGVTQATRDKYVDTLLGDTLVLLRMLRDDYGNYVVQTALMEASPQRAERLVQEIRPLMHHIRNAPYAKKLEAKMELTMKKRHHHSHGGAARCQEEPRQQCNRQYRNNSSTPNSGS